MPVQVPSIGSFFNITGIVLAVAVIAIILILILLKLYQVKSAARAQPGAAGTNRVRTGSTSVSPPISSDAGTKPQKPASLEKEPRRGLELHDQGDISKNMQAFIEKYRFDSFTLSSDDGLVIASTSLDGQQDAANYSQSFRTGNDSPEPGTFVFGMTHRGATVIGIIKSSRNLPGPVPAELEADANNILNWGL